MKKLIPALCMLLIAAAMLGTSTYAWFSMNKTVTATGMQVKATSAASLVIDSSAANLKTNRSVTLGLTAKTDAIAPSTLDWSTYTTSGLGYVTNPEDVDPNTGLKKSTDGAPDLVIKDISNDTSTTKYYLDYDVYVAAAGSSMTAALEAKIDATVTKTLHKAFTVAFYVDSVSATNYKGSLRFNQTGESDKVTLVARAENSIPEADGENAIHVVMRVYLDGAYAETSGTANVNNGTVETNSVTFGVSFTAAE